MGGYLLYTHFLVDILRYIFSFNSYRGIIVQKEALEMSSEFLRLFTIEALHRTAGYQREQEDEELKDVETLVELDSLEAITPQLVMDF